MGYVAKDVRGKTNRVLAAGKGTFVGDVHNALGGVAIGEVPLTPERVRKLVLATA